MNVISEHWTTIAKIKVDVKNIIRKKTEVSNNLLLNCIYVCYK